MMQDAAHLTTIARLIAMKREELDRYRQDLRRLEHIVDAARIQFDLAQKCESDFLDSMRQAEHARKALDATEMIDRRRYLLHLKTVTTDQGSVFDQAVEQRDQAQRSLDKVFAEIRTLERLAERRRTRAAAERQRIGYLQADDQEITRNTHLGGVNVHH